MGGGEKSRGGGFLANYFRVLKKSSVLLKNSYTYGELYIFFPPRPFLAPLDSAPKFVGFMRTKEDSVPQHPLG